MLFNRNANTDPYCILFHDSNAISGHYEPLLYKNLGKYNFKASNTYFLAMCKYLEDHSKCIACDMHSHGLEKPKSNTSDCGYIMFCAIFYLITRDFDV